MKFMIFVKSNPRLEKGIEAMSDSAMKDSMAKMDAFNAELRKAGVMKDCDGLRPSREGKYISLTATVNATSQEQLDALYRELCDHPTVVMVL